MNANQLRPASEFATRSNVKILTYGAPGSGKTPALKTAPRPVVCLIENGAGSLSDAHNIPAWGGFTLETANEFLDWVLKSNEAKNFDTICMDSISQYCELQLGGAKKRNSHGMKAYGEMQERVMEKLNALYALKEKHLYIIAKEMTIEIGGASCLRPYFPGKALSSEIPHLFDVILHAEKINLPGHPKPVNAFRAQETFNILARDRYGKLAEHVPQDLTYIINTSMQ